MMACEWRMLSLWCGSQTTVLCILGQCLLPSHTTQWDLTEQLKSAGKTSAKTGNWTFYTARDSVTIFILSHLRAWDLLVGYMPSMQPVHLGLQHKPNRVVQAYIPSTHTRAIETEKLLSSGSASSAQEIRSQPGLKNVAQIIKTGSQSTLEYSSLRWLQGTLI